MQKVLLLIVFIVFIGISIKNIFIDEFNQNGVYYKFSIDEEITLTQKLNYFAILIKRQLDREDIIYDYIEIDENKLIFEHLDSDDTLKITKVLNEYSSIFTIEQNEYIYSLSFKSEYLEKQKSELLEKTKYVLEKRLEEMGLYNSLFDIFLSEITTVITSDDNFIEINIPKLCDKCPREKVNQVLGVIGYFKLISVNEKCELSKDSIPIIDSSMLKKVSFVFENDKDQLNIQVNKYATKILADYTASNIFKKVAIVVDNKIYATPKIVDGIFDGFFTVDLEGFTAKEMDKLALIINSGALPTQLFLVKRYYIQSVSIESCLVN